MLRCAISATQSVRMRCRGDLSRSRKKKRMERGIKKGGINKATMLWKNRTNTNDTYEVVKSPGITTQSAPVERKPEALMPQVRTGKGKFAP